MALDPGIAQEIRRFQAQYDRKPDSFAFARLADAYRKAGDAARALELLDRGLERHPRYLSAHIVRARALAELGRREKAAAAYRRVLELDPQNLVALRAVAGMARDAGRWEEAVAAYRKLREVDPLEDEVRERLAEAERRLARGRAEAPSTPAATGPVPEPPEAREAPAEELPEVREAEELPEAREVEEPPEVREAEEPRKPLVAAEETPPRPGDEDLVVTATMGDLFLRQELYEQAVRIYERLLATRPGDPFLWEKLETARRLARGKARGSRATAGTEPSRPPGGRETGPAGAAAPPGREPGEAADGAPATRPGTTFGDEPVTIREYLQRLLEGRAASGPGRPGPASRFERWLRRGEERQG